jgi:hypothetical protein
MKPLDFLSDFREMLVDELRHLGYVQSENEGVEQIFVRYLNVTSRIPEQQPWHVHKSRELSNLTLRPKIASGLASFIEAAEDGKDLRPWVSDEITDADFRDLMFYDWGIYHFHLGNGFRPDGFTKRTDELLFAITGPRSADMYLLNILPHPRKILPDKNSFEDQDLLRIVEDNWPALLNPYTVRIKSLVNRPTNEDIGQYRRVGLVAFVETPGGRVLSPMGGGITTGKTSLRLSLDADYMLRVIKWIQEETQKRLPYFAQELTSRYHVKEDQLEIHLVEFGKPYQVTEITTQAILMAGATGLGDT